MTQTTQELTGKELFLAEFARFENQPATGGQAWLRDLRQVAIGRFGELGIPNQRVEAWRFTNLAPLTKTTFRTPAESYDATHPAPGQELIRALELGATELSCAVFVNGRFAPARSSLASLPQGVRITSLAAAFTKKIDLIKPHLAQYANYQEHPFVALNTALMEDGALVEIDRDTVVAEPLHLLFLTLSEDDGPILTHPRNLILAGENSQAKIVESYAGRPGSVYFTNAVTEIVVGENAVLDHTKVQEESESAFHIATLHARQARSSNFSSTSVALGGALVRNDASTTLAGEGCECALNGLTLAHGRQHIDNHTRLDHAMPHCSSHQVYKSILDDRSSAVFTGRIIVRPDAQKTDAIQSSRNLLLTETAGVNTQPQLEIFADDVRCTHGATVGQLDSDAIFYLRSRGIAESVARGLLTFAFANEVIERIKIEPLRFRLERLIATRFQFNASPEDNQ